MTVQHGVTLPTQLAAAKIVFGELVREFGGQEAAGRFLGVRQQAISDGANPNTDFFPRLDWVIRLQAVVRGRPGAPHVTRYLAEQDDMLLVARPTFGAGPSGDLLQALARAGREHGEGAAALLTALADGVLSDAEIDHALEQACQAADEWSGICALLRERKGEA